MCAGVRKRVMMTGPVRTKRRANWQALFAVTPLRTPLRMAALQILAILCAGASFAAPVRLNLEPVPEAIQHFAMPVAVFSDDRRSPLPDPLRGLKDRIGLLVDERSRTVCTAFCVAPDMVATAAHCVFHRSLGAGPLKPADIWFSKKGMTGTERVRITGSDTGKGLGNIMSGTTRLRLKPPIDATDDWAVVRLAQPVCEGGTLPVKSLSADRLLGEAAAGRIYQVAFHQDFRDWQLALDRSCEIRSEFDGLDANLIRKEFSAPRNLILHRCDTGEGSSGSPLLLDATGGPFVVGINVGTYLQSRLLLRGGLVIKRFAPATVANTGVSAAEFADRLVSFQTSETIAETADVKRLQAAMAERRLYAGVIDGILGEQTRKAIRDVQRQLGEVDTGLPSVALFEKLGLSLTAQTVPAIAGQQVPTAATGQ
jgi:Trypsin-like peptidase domain/Putative peptidoglycan binding domain